MNTLKIKYTCQNKSSIQADNSESSARAAMHELGYEAFSGGLVTPLFFYYKIGDATAQEPVTVMPVYVQ